MEEKKSLWNPFSVNEMVISGDHSVKRLPKQILGTKNFANYFPYGSYFLYFITFITHVKVNSKELLKYSFNVLLYFLLLNLAE